MTETGKVGTYGGINLPTVTIFMKGFQPASSSTTRTTARDVELIGWDNADPDDGLFTGDFEDQAKGRATTETLLDQGADIIMPVAGPGGPGLDRGHRGRRRRRQAHLGRHRRLRVASRSAATCSSPR